jgi:hypothetical protein
VLVDILVQIDSGSLTVIVRQMGFQLNGAI